MKIKTLPLLLILGATGVVFAAEKSSDKAPAADKKAVAKESCEDCCCETETKTADAKKEPAKPAPAPAREAKSK